MIEPERISLLNTRPVRGRGEYVLYWMQAAQRADYNHALEFAIQRANDLHLPVLVLFGLTDNYPQANLRHYRFMLEGLLQTQTALAGRGIKLVIRHKSPDSAAVEMARNAAIVVIDAGQLRIQRQWRQSVAKKIDCPLYEVETNLIVPVAQASLKEEFSAGTFRPRITAKLLYYLKIFQHAKLKIKSTFYGFDGFDISDVDKALRKLKIDTSVKAGTFAGGIKSAKTLLKEFIAKKLDKFTEYRNDPNSNCVSNLSPYLHFGQISPLQIALEVLETNSPGKEAFLEELIVRRELSHNFIRFNRRYDDFDALPAWAKRTLNFHKSDKREYIYTLREFEDAQTNDPYWNAAQKEMVLTGKMHGYMRMYWGKKIIEWSKSPQQAFKTALYLNDKYELDGRDPNGFAGVAWCFGKHDRAWSERPVYGKIRYMNAAGLKRKFDADAYARNIEQMERNLENDI